MLVLTRKRSEMIHIGEDIIIKVIRTGRGTVKIGIDAPDHIRVLRAELCDISPVVDSMNGAEASGGNTTDVCSDQNPHPHTV